MVREFLKSVPAARSIVDAARHLRRRLFMRREGEAVLHRACEQMHGRPVNVENPTFFTERLLAWMIELHRQPEPRFSMLADKLASRDYVEERLGPEFLTAIYWHGKEPDRVPFDDLPERFVIKPTHSSGQVIVGGPGLDRGEAVQEMSRWLERNYYWGGREYQYLDIPHRLMIEEFIDDGMEGGPFDYSFWCFHGVARLVQLRKYPRVVNQFYDLDWNLLPLKTRAHLPDVDFQRPPLLDEMRDAAETLAKGLEFVRVDFYSPPGRILFGELTLTPSAGRMWFHPPEWDATLGEWWGQGQGQPPGVRAQPATLEERTLRE